MRGRGPALRGEFTERAVRNGKLDLLQAEAIADLIEARSAATHRAALRQMGGALSRQLETLRSALLDLEALLASKPKRMAVMKDELATVVQTFGDDRRTEIVSDEGEFSIEDLIANEEMVVTISHAGYIQAHLHHHLPQAAPRRGGTKGTELRTDDFVEHLFVAKTHDYLLGLTQDGRCFLAQGA